MRVLVLDSVGQPVALSSDLGRKIRDVYGDAWRSERIVLDFSGIRNVSPSFLSQAVMPILLEFSRDEIGDHVEFLEPPASFESVWKAVLDAIEARRASSRNP
jgi:hypothetical protein